MRQAPLFRRWSLDVRLVQHQATGATEEEREKPAVRGIRAVPGEAVAVEVAGDRITGVRLTGAASCRAVADRR